MSLCVKVCDWAVHFFYLHAVHLAVDIVHWSSSVRDIVLSAILGGICLNRTEKKTVLPPSLGEWAVKGADRPRSQTDTKSVCYEETRRNSSRFTADENGRCVSI